VDQQETGLAPLLEVVKVVFAAISAQVLESDLNHDLHERGGVKLLAQDGPEIFHLGFKFAVGLLKLCPQTPSQRPRLR